MRRKDKEITDKKEKVWILSWLNIQVEPLNIPVKCLRKLL